MSDATFGAFRARLERAGLSQNAATWLTKALSPATPTATGAMIPDSSTIPVATPEHIVTGTFGPPPGATGTWDCLVLKPPTYPTVAVVMCAPAGTDFRTIGNAIPGTYSVHVLSTEMSSSAVPQKESVAMWSASLTAPVLATTSCFTPSALPLRWRATARSATEYLVASDLVNQGTVTSGLYPARYVITRPWDVSGTGITVNASWQWSSFQVPLDEENMTAMNPKVRVAPAKTGVYQPVYSNGPNFDWACPFPRASVLGTVNGTSGLTGYNWVTTSNPPSAPTWTVVGANPGIIGFQDPTRPFFNDKWLPASLNPDPLTGFLPDGVPYTWGTGNEMVGISLYRGLNVQASLTVKVVLGLELVCSPSSPIRQFAVPPPPNEPNALQLYYDLVAEMPHSYPASANFLSAVVSAAQTLLPMILPHLPAIVGGIGQLITGQRTGPSQPEMRGSAGTVAVSRVRSSSVGSRVSRVSSKRKVRQRVRVAKPKKR